MRVLILVAHPDDEVIMCGATIDKLVKKGHSVFVTFFTLNEQAYFDKEEKNSRRQRAISEAQNSSKMLGFEANFLGFYDMEVEKNKGLLLQKTIEEIRRVEPDIIITHYSRDKHIDHRTLGEIVPEANFQSGCKLCGGRKTWSASTVLEGEVNLEMAAPFDFQLVSAVSEENIKRKIQAFGVYSSVKDEHNAEFEWLNDKLRISAMLRGRSIGVHNGEAFIINDYSPLGSKSILKIAMLLEV